MVGLPSISLSPQVGISYRSYMDYKTIDRAMLALLDRCRAKAGGEAVRSHATACRAQLIVLSVELISVLSVSFIQLRMSMLELVDFAFDQNRFRFVGKLA